MVDSSARGHLEAAVAGDDPDVFLRAGDLCADCSRKRKAHGAEAARGDERARSVMLVVLGLPHLVLADVGDDDGLVCSASGLSLAPDVVDDVRGVEVAVVGEIDDVANGGVALLGVDLAEPTGVGVLWQQREEEFEDFLEVADEGDVGANVLVDLGGVDLDVDLLRVRGVVGEVAGDAVVEAHAEGEQQVGLLDGVVDPRFAVHAHHAERERVMRGHAAEAEKRAGDGDLLAFGEGENLGFGAGVRDAVAGEDEGLLCGLDEFDGLLDGRGFGAQHGVRAVGCGSGGFEVERRGGLLRVFRYIDKNRTRTAGLRDLEAPRGWLGRCLRRG